MPADQERQIITDIPELLLENTIGRQLTAVATKFPERVAVQTECIRLTYKQLDQQSDALALGLSRLGLQPFERVAACLGNLAEFVVVIYACAKLGVILAPLNPAYTEVQLISALNHISATCVVLSTETSLPYKAPRLAKVHFQGVVEKEGRSKNAPSLKHVLVINNSTTQCDREGFPGALWYDELLEKHHGQLFDQSPILKPSDIINIQFTSGTTSSPKAACLTHTNILNNGFLVGSGMKLTELDVICCAPPLFHCFGIVLGLLAAMVRAVLDSVIKHQATALYGVPTMFLAELAELPKRSARDNLFLSLRTGLIGGSAIAPALRQRLRKELHLSSLLNIYGMTESSPVVCMTRLDDEDEINNFTVGSVLPHTEIKIVSRDRSDQTLLRGQKGELLMSGYPLMKCYWNDEQKTADAFVVESDTSPQGSGSDQNLKIWLRSGDEAAMRMDGTIEITGRIKDIIIRGGENIYPAEIENFLLQHNLVNNVAVVGLPDDYYGEVISAFIVVQEHVTIPEGQAQDGLTIDLRENSKGQACITADNISHEKVLTSGDIRDWVRTRFSRNNIPKFVFWVSRMPLTASGKVEKYKLKDIGLKALLRLEEVRL
ncbi:hypothetical protein TWF718_004130 [Orbilia javanica]|uniref:Uncharacterized protein n=1 Tax=Orbilia javanica TaxID=47235 RepID=A0AAN8RES6_9PEZI